MGTHWALNFLGLILCLRYAYLRKFEIIQICAPMAVNGRFTPCHFTPRHYICDILPRDILPRGFLPLGCYSALHMWRQGIKGCKVRHKDFVLHDVFSFTFVFTKLLFTTFYPLHCCINHNTLWFMIIQVIKCREVQQFTPSFLQPSLCEKASGKISLQSTPYYELFSSRRQELRTGPYHIMSLA